MPARSFDRDVFLQALDNCAELNRFPRFDTLMYPANARLSVYAATDWIVLVEISVFNPRMGGVYGVLNWYWLFGNCLRQREGTAENIPYKSDYRQIFENGPEEPLFLADTHPERGDGETICPEAKSISLRQSVIPISVKPADYAAAGIPMRDLPWIRGEEFLRWFTWKYPELPWLLESEISQELLQMPPLVLRLGEWHHPDILSGEKPSQSEFFNLLADVIEAGRASKYRPSEKPNTHWSNWPMAGSF